MEVMSSPQTPSSGYGSSKTPSSGFSHLSSASPHTPTRSYDSASGSMKDGNTSAVQGTDASDTVLSPLTSPEPNSLSSQHEHDIPKKQSEYLHNTVSKLQNSLQTSFPDSTETAASNRMSPSKSPEPEPALQNEPSERSDPTPASCSDDSGITSDSSKAHPPSIENPKPQLPDPPQTQSDYAPSNSFPNTSFDTIQKPSPKPAAEHLQTNTSDALNDAKLNMSSPTSMNPSHINYGPAVTERSAFQDVPSQPSAVKQNQSFDRNSNPAKDTPTVPSTVDLHPELQALRSIPIQSTPASCLPGAPVPPQRQSSNNALSNREASAVSTENYSPADFIPPCATALKDLPGGPARTQSQLATRNEPSHSSNPHNSHTMNPYTATTTPSSLPERHPTNHNNMQPHANLQRQRSSNSVNQRTNALSHTNNMSNQHVPTPYSAPTTDPYSNRHQEHLPNKTSNLPNAVTDRPRNHQELPRSVPTSNDPYGQYHKRDNSMNSPSVDRRFEGNNPSTSHTTSGMPPGSHSGQMQSSAPQHLVSNNSKSASLPPSYMQQQHPTTNIPSSKPPSAGDRRKDANLPTSSRPATQQQQTSYNSMTTSSQHHATNSAPSQVRRSNNSAVAAEHEHRRNLQQSAAHNAYDQQAKGLQQQYNYPSAAALASSQVNPASSKLLSPYGAGCKCVALVLLVKSLSF